MKTAISLPDETFDRATARARALGMSRSEFFARAAERYLDDLDDALLTDEINAALDAVDDPDDSAAAAVAIGRRTLIAADDEW